MGNIHPLNFFQAEYLYSLILLCFPGSSDGKESICNAGDLGSLPGSERALEKEMATHSSIHVWKILTARRAWWVTVHGVAKSLTRLSDQHYTDQLVKNPPANWEIWV